MPPQNRAWKFFRGFLEIVFWFIDFRRFVYKSMVWKIVIRNFALSKVSFGQDELTESSVLEIEPASTDKFSRSFSQLESPDKIFRYDAII